MIRVLIAFLAGCFFGVGLTKAKAQQPDFHLSIPAPQKPGDFGWQHAQNHDWYQENMQNCCSSGECRETVARWEASGWTVLVDGNWYHVPEHVIKKGKDGIPITHPDGKPHVCASFITKSIWCFSVPNVET